MANESAEEETTLALLLDLPPMIVSAIEKRGEGVGARLHCRIVGLATWYQAEIAGAEVIATTLKKLEEAESGQLELLKAQGVTFLLVMYSSENVELTITRGQQLLEGARVHYVTMRTEEVFSASLLLSQFEGGPLSAREVEILQLVAEGKSNKQIGELLYISALTVKQHLYRIARKLEIEGNRALAVMVGFQRGYLL